MVWQIDKSHSEVGFSVRHMMISNVRGRFTDFDAEVSIDPAALTQAKVSAKIAAQSIDTGEARRDGHLRSADFLDAENSPYIQFQSKRVSQAGNDLTVVGDLTVRGTTREVTLKGEYEGPSKDPWGNQRLGFSLAGEIDREDFGLTWNQALETGGVLVAKKVKLQLEIQVTSQG